MTSTRRFESLLLVAPGAALILLAIGIDVLRGGDWIGDWGSGQTVLVIAGVLMCLGGAALSRKAFLDERQGKRGFWRTVAFVVFPLMIAVVFPVLLAEWLFRFAPPSTDLRGRYQQTDAVTGISLKPGRAYRVISRPKDFDIRIDVDSQGFRIGPSQGVVPLPQADVVVLGDSHPFGFGIAAQQTFPEQLSTALAAGELPSQVVNACVPGFGLGQCYLRLLTFQNDRSDADQTGDSLPERIASSDEQSRGPFRQGGTVVLFVNPMNDMVNLCCAIDYHFPKPHAVLSNHRLDFRTAPDWRGEPFLFSPTFQTLNTVFGLAPRGRPWTESALLARAGELWRPAVQSDSEIQILEDLTRPEEYREINRQLVQQSPLAYASRYWPEGDHFANERLALRELTFGVLQRIREVAQDNRWRCIVVVAPEAHVHQDFSKGVFQQVAREVPQFQFRAGWSRRTMLELLDEVGLAHVAPRYPASEIDACFLQNDDHTSALGHGYLAAAVAEWLGHQNLPDTPIDPSAQTAPSTRPRPNQ